MKVLSLNKENKKGMENTIILTFQGRISAFSMPFSEVLIIRKRLLRLVWHIPLPNVGGNLRRHNGRR